MSLPAAGSLPLWLVLMEEVKHEHPVRTSEQGREEARVPGAHQGGACVVHSHCPPMLREGQSAAVFCVAVSMSQGEPVGDV